MEGRTSLCASSYPAVVVDEPQLTAVGAGGAGGAVGGWTGHDENPL